MKAWPFSFQMIFPSSSLSFSALTIIKLFHIPFRWCSFCCIQRMAEPISLASGIVALATFAFTSSVSLYQVVGSFQNNQRNMRRLKEEVEALNGVLRSLRGIAAGNPAGLEGLDGLNLPLLHCGKACKDFEAEIIKCTAHYGGSRTSFRDWAKLKYMGDDIAGFKNMLAGYKSTIIIALGDANLSVSCSNLFLTSS